ncbi:CPBP family intramembrane glutamic endopeptidase [Haloglomus salinum]|uniref:CPBP family intramembrane glutamic endopeptidase n=1 Tax=Haloglomus salinum TaxID=2962673 RepID=UPI0020C9E93D|nr:type II CAAX endopeptidase family protein [Haloglomus salinum]
MRTADLDSHSVEPLMFRGGLSLLGVFIAFMAIFLAGWTAYVTPTLQHVFGLSSADPWRVVLNVFPGAIMLSVGYVVLRLEGIRSRDVGLSWPHARSGTVWFVGIIIVLNVLLLLVAVVTGGQLSWSYTDQTPVLIIVYALINWIFVGIAEELVARAYLQNKLIALVCGGQGRFRKALAIVAAAVLFALWHVPQRLLVAGLDVPQLPLNILLLLVAGLVFGILYETTRNVVLVGLLHGAYNFAPIVANVRYATEGSADIQFLLLLAVAGPVIIGVWGYYRWAHDRRTSDFRPPVAG